MLLLFSYPASFVAAEAIFFAEHKFSISDCSTQPWKSPPNKAQVEMFSKVKEVAYETSKEHSKRRGESPKTVECQDEDFSSEEETDFVSPKSFRDTIFRSTTDQ